MNRNPRFLVVLLDEHGAQVRVPVVDAPGPVEQDRADRQFEVTNIVLPAAGYALVDDDNNERVTLYERGELKGSLGLTAPRDADAAAAAE